MIALLLPSYSTSETLDQFVKSGFNMLILIRSKLLDGFYLKTHPYPLKNNFLNLQILF